MKTDPDFKKEIMNLNGNRVTVLVPKKSISLEEGIKRAKEIFKKYN